jgi:xanthine dehydrogenase YagT iron-sulfur-binding subunit
MPGFRQRLIVLASSVSLRASAFPDEERFWMESSRFPFSRRDFLKTVGAGGLAAGAIAPAETDAQPAVREIGPGEVPVQLTINGRRHDLKVEPRTTLLDAMRNRLDITGVKRVCDRGTCGACTMFVDGKTVYGCSTLAIEAQGKQIRTVESFTQGTVLHPVQQAFCESDGLMCGFCTPGFVTSAVALLEKNPNPTPEQARKALDGNICRCGTYPRVLEAVLKTKGVTRA